MFCNALLQAWRDHLLAAEAYRAHARPGQAFNLGSARSNRHPDFPDAPPDFPQAPFGFPWARGGLVSHGFRYRPGREWPTA